MKPPLSLVVITLNEEENIARCLQSVPIASDIVVLDSGSTDQTQKIADKYGARVFSEEWRGFRAQKERATQLAENDWVILLDADEALDDEGVKAIKRLFDLKVIESHDAYQISRKSFHLGRWIEHGGWRPDYQIRLFNRKRTQWIGGHLHENIAASRIGKILGTILHWPFSGVADQVLTNNRYSTLAAQDLFEKGKSFSFFKLIIKPFSKFIECYFLKAGFKDGLPGFIIAIGAAYSVFLKWSKLWEKHKIKP